MTPKPRNEEVNPPGALYWEPRDGYYATKVKLHDDLHYPIEISGILFSIKNAKVIYEWLGRAIEYLESKK